MAAGSLRPAAHRPAGTREAILDAAEALFYSAGIRGATMTDIAERAGLTKRTLYYHFRSKDDLIEACLMRLGTAERDRFAMFLGEAEVPVDVRIKRMFDALARDVIDPRWKGCYFARAASELAGLPGHPGLRAAVIHRKAVERWIAAVLAGIGLTNADTLARSLMLLLDGAIAQGFLHHDPTYVHQAGELASRLVTEAVQAWPDQACMA
jgi:AcrR family transcriptional regulator